MKREILGSLLLLSLSFAAYPTQAAEQASEVSSPSATAFNVSYLALHGYLKNEGIPSGSRLMYEVSTGRIKAEDIVNAAIKRNYASKDALNDSAYLRAVEANLTEQPTQFER